MAVTAVRLRSNSIDCTEHLVVSRFASGNLPYLHDFHRRTCPQFETQEVAHPPGGRIGEVASQ